VLNLWNNKALERSAQAFLPALIEYCSGEAQALSFGLDLGGGLFVNYGSIPRRFISLWRSLW
jgi:hypothetical protein